MRYNIPLQANAPRQTFVTQLDGNMYRFRLRWLTLYEYFAVDLYEGTDADAGAAITLGRGLFPQMNIVRGLNLGMGSIALEGDVPTVSNLGKENRLIYDSEGGDD